MFPSLTLFDLDSPPSSTAMENSTGLLLPLLGSNVSWTSGTGSSTTLSLSEGLENGTKFPGNGSTIFHDYNDEDADEHYVLDRLEVKAILFTLHTLVFCSCFFGNLIVVLVVTLHWRMRSITNFCLGNLAFANLCVGVFCIYQNFAQYFIKDWIFGDFMCKMYHFINSLSCTSSILILVVICIERYLAITDPIRSRQILTKTRLRICIIFVWFISAVYCSPRLFLCGTIVVPYDGTTEIICILLVKKLDGPAYDIANFLLTFLGPMIVLTVLYSSIGVTLWRTSRLNQTTSMRSTTSLPTKAPSAAAALPPDGPSSSSHNSHSRSTPSNDFSSEDEVETGIIPPTSSSASSTKRRMYIISTCVSPSGTNNTLTPDPGTPPLGVHPRRPHSRLHSFLSLWLLRFRRSASKPFRRSSSRKKHFKKPHRRGSSAASLDKEPSTTRVAQLKLDDASSDFCTESSSANVDRRDSSSALTLFKPQESTRGSSSSFRKARFSYSNGKLHSPSVSMSAGGVPAAAESVPTPTRATSFKRKGSKRRKQHMSRSNSLRHNGKGAENTLANPSLGVVEKSVVAHNNQKAASSSPPKLKRMGAMRICRIGNQALNSRRRVIRMLIVIVVTFAICNLPFHVRKIWLIWTPQPGGDTFSQLFTPVTFLIMYANCAVNPILYAFMSTAFRASFKDLLSGRHRASLENQMRTKSFENTDCHH